MTPYQSVLIEAHTLRCYNYTLEFEHNTKDC